MPKTPFIVGGSIVEYPVVITKDSDYLFAISSSYVKAFNTNTGGLYRVLSCGDALCGIFINPLNELQLFSVLKNGGIQLWDYANAKVINRYNIGKEIQCLMMHPKETKLYFTSGSDFFEADITDEGLQEPRSLFRVGKALDIKTTNDGSFVAILSSNQAQESTVYVYDAIKKRLLRFFNERSSKQHFTLAIHPKGDCLILGDLDGIIFLFDFQDKSNVKSFRNALDIEKKKEITPVKFTPVTSVHWHSSKILALSFTLDGSYFLSSSKEAVLVEWKMNEYTRRFFPRFGDCISFIQQTTDGFRYCVSLPNSNSIVLFSPQSDERALIIEGIKLGVYNIQKHINFLHPSTYKGRIESKLTLDPFSKALAFSGTAGNIQIYDPILETHLLEVPIGTFSNVVEGAYGSLGLCHVQEICFSLDGTRVATVDWRPLNEDQEITLKFWDRNQNEFVLNTVAKNPHSEKVNGLICHPKQDLVVSFSDDGKFKIWGTVQGKNSLIWICKSVFSYQNRIPTNATFSKDGSIIAISFDENITLWDCKKLLLKQTLTFSNEDILGLGFVTESLLVSYTKNGIYVWDLTSCSVKWSYRARVTALNVDLNNETFAIAVEQIWKRYPDQSYNVLFFSAESAIPLNVWKTPSRVSEIIFLPEKNERGTSAIICRIKNKQLLVLSEETRSEKRSETEKPFVPKVLHTQAALPSTSKNTTPLFATETLKSTHSIFNTPSHVVPSLDSIFNPLMDSLLTRKGNTSKQGESSNKRKDERGSNDSSDNKKSKQ